MNSESASPMNSDWAPAKLLKEVSWEAYIDRDNHNSKNCDPD